MAGSTLANHPPASGHGPTNHRGRPASPRLQWSDDWPAAKAGGSQAGHFCKAGMQSRRYPTSCHQMEKTSGRKLTILFIKIFRTIEVGICDLDTFTTIV